MKDSESTWEVPWASWVSLPQPAGHLLLNTFDFSDLWDDEDLRLDGVEQDRPSGSPRDAPIPPPLPPIGPSLAPFSPMGTPTKAHTLKLHWKEIPSLHPLPRATHFGTQPIWAGLEPVQLDPNRLQDLFGTNSPTCKVATGQKKPPSRLVLGIKRSNIVTIALSRLPPPHLLPLAIHNMDTRVLDREDIQRLEALVPSEEELALVRESQAPGSPLGQAERCLLMLGEIPHLRSRLQLWAFALDYDTLEKEVAEPLYHLKTFMEQLATSQTFRNILATVLAVGNFLNGRKDCGFELSYLGKLSQVRDTSSHQPLLHHVCVQLLQLYPQSSDLHSDITAATRASKCDYSSVRSNLVQLELQLKASWQQLNVLESMEERRRGGEKDKRRGGGGEEEAMIVQGSLRWKLPRFLREVEQRLKVLQAIHRRVINRFHSFLLYLGYSRAMAKETKAEEFCKSLSDFSLEFRATRQVALQWREREQEKGGRDTVGGRRKHYPPPSKDCLEQRRLEEILKTPEVIARQDATLPRSRRKIGPFTQKKTV